jgi:DNA-binding NtrC family response regulator
VPSFALDSAGRPQRAHYRGPADLEQGGDQSNAGIYDSLLEKRLGLPVLERQMIEHALRKTGGNRSAAARLLGISRAQINYRIDKSKRRSGREQA